MEDNAKVLKKVDEQTSKLLNKTFTLAMVLVVGVLVFFVGQLIYQGKSLDNQNNDQITVSGQGKIYAKPDIALISLGVKTEGLTVSDVTKKNTNKMNSVIDAIKSLKIDEKDIQTTSYNLDPLYNWTEKEGRIFEGYSLTQQIQIKIRDFTKIGDVLSAGTDNGANLVNALQFTIDEPEQLRQEARAKAIKEAKSNAKNLAKESGIKLGKIVNVYENYNPYPVMYSMDKVGGMGGGVESSVPSIQPGQQEINVTINLTYQVK